MRNLLAPICWWLRKEPDVHIETENIDQAIREIKELNERQAHFLNKVQQPDILRSLVISMNAGRNT